jgi:hypothetical protein
VGELKPGTHFGTLRAALQRLRAEFRAAGDGEFAEFFPFESVRPIPRQARKRLLSVMERAGLKVQVGSLHGRNPIDVRDMGIDSHYALRHALARKGVDLDEFDKLRFASSDEIGPMMQAMEKRWGIDTLAYVNNVEDPGSISYVALSPPTQFTAKRVIGEPERLLRGVQAAGAPPNISLREQVGSEHQAKLAVLQSFLRGVDLSKLSPESRATIMKRLRSRDLSATVK